MGRFFKRAAVTTLLTGLIVAVPASSAFAWHCFVVNRSETAAVKAGGSGNWFTLDLAAILVEEFGIDAETVAQIVVRLGEEGVPTTVALFERQLLMNKSPQAWAGGYGDGKGIDSFFVGPYFGTLVEVLAEFGIEIPDEG